MKIFNWIFSSFFRTLGRFLFYIAVGLIAMLFISGKVNAQTYKVSNNGSTASLYVPNGTTNISFGNNYTNASGQGMTQILLKLILDDTNDVYNILEAGSYLLDFYVVSNQLDTDLSNCKDFNSDYRFTDLTSGNSIVSSSSIKSQCINSFYTKVSGVNAIHYLVQFTITNTASYPFMTKELLFYNNLWHGLGFVQGGATWNVTLGNLTDYDSAIVTSFNNEANSQTQINQNQTIIDQNNQTNNKLDTQINQNDTIINQNNATNDKLDSLNGNLTSTEGADLGALQNSAGWLPAGPVDSILNLPLSLLNNLTTNLNKSCQPVILPIPYVNKDLTLPCVNTLYDDMGISGWVTTIGVIASAFIMFSYLVKLYKWVDDTLSFRENNSIDNWGGV